MQTITIQNTMQESIQLVPANNTAYKLFVNNVDTLMRFTKHATFQEVQRAINNYYLGK